MTTITPIDPATGITHLPLEAATATDVTRAVKAARRAFEGWKLTSFDTRRQYLLAIAEILLARAEDIGKIIMSEMGRARSEAIPEVKKSAAFFKYFAEHGQAMLETETVNIEGLTLPEKRAYIQFEPRGVIAVIKPWNAPVQQIVWAIAPALMAGCTAVVKPSEYTPRSALALQSAIDDAGLPPSTVVTVIGSDDTGRALVESDVDMITFTGSVAAGREVACVAGRRLKKVVLELSGKDALIVDQNISDIELVTSGIVYGAFSNCGHWCSSVERVFLPESRYEELLAMIVAKTRALRIGPPNDPNIDIGPIANERQLSIIMEIVGDALSKGATAITGARRINRSGYFYEPTILTNVTRDMRMYHENVFGPVVAIEKYKNVDDALHEANNTQYGLGLSVWTESEEFATYVIDRCDTGMVWVNEPLQSIAACPWSVCKNSGIGTELGIHGLREFTYPKVVNSQLTGSRGRRPWYFPYGG